MCVCTGEYMCLLQGGGGGGGGGVQCGGRVLGVIWDSECIVPTPTSNL